MVILIALVAAIATLIAARFRRRKAVLESSKATNPKEDEIYEEIPQEDIHLREEDTKTTLSNLTNRAIMVSTNQAYGVSSVKVNNNDEYEDTGPIYNVVNEVDTDHVRIPSNAPCGASSDRITASSNPDYLVVIADTKEGEIKNEEETDDGYEISDHIQAIPSKSNVAYGTMTTSFKQV